MGIYDNTKTMLTIDILNEYANRLELRIAYWSDATIFNPSPGEYRIYIRKHKLSDIPILKNRFLRRHAIALINISRKVKEYPKKDGEYDYNNPIWEQQQVEISFIQESYEKIINEFVALLNKEGIPTTIRPYPTGKF